MGKRTIAVLALGLLASACSSNKEAQREDEAPATAQAPSEQVMPKTGVITSVDAQRLMLDTADDPGSEADLYERTTRSVVVREGSEVSWDDLQEGDVVRVTWDRGVFGPDRVAQVEVLAPEEADQVRERMQGDMEVDTDENGIGSPMEPREIESPTPGDMGTGSEPSGSGY